MTIILCSDYHIRLEHAFTDLQTKITTSEQEGYVPLAPASVLQTQKNSYQFQTVV